MRATVFGAQGFVGRHLTQHLRREGWEVVALGRGDAPPADGSLGHVFYCIGLTADFRSRPFETIEAHVSLAAELLREGRFDSFLYCSSTRVYAGAAEATETARIEVDPGDPSDLYNLSKLMGEAACLAVSRPEARIARLSNVFGADDASENFLTSILTDAVRDARVVLQSSPDSAKDYVAVEDVATALARIAVQGRERIYNVAAGRNTSHAALLAAIRAATGCEVAVAHDKRPQVFPLIATERLQALGDWRPVPVEACIPALVEGARRRLSLARQ
ncbi:NAD-dependent epimerase/dehydratase family protein [Phenylobacterium montanum]|uniref:NAD-dependent epimerase/dehydratase family protein n=1 Tax=Phenylobacterium montanum TaxID=2823693 RepID=A0A975ITY0_9CAUL|nr:SDR family oxidoreductase [Caulobacter sp. S6]QUD87228.1 NAD-dependent epimerase/dehydratase family protein [Caulobacter sp. S6]